MSTVTIDTSRFGPVEVSEASIISFVSPILGFEKQRRYVLLDHSENSPFKWLQAAETPELAFVVTNPKFFNIPYEFVMPDEVVEKLGVTEAEDVVVFTIVNIPNDNPTLMTANLLAPIVVNQSNMQAMQMVLNDKHFSTRTRLLPDDSQQKAKSPATSHHEKG